jgi:hypothetical protein
LPAGPISKRVREVRVRTATGKILRLVTNDPHSPPEVISELYKHRWAIELFFCWIKQTLKIRQFLGTSENALRIQIIVALIAFLSVATDTARVRGCHHAARLRQAGEDQPHAPAHHARPARVARGKATIWQRTTGGAAMGMNRTLVAQGQP